MQATVPSAAEPTRGVTVVGFGEAKAAPDIARAHLGVEARESSAEAAMARANERMSAVLRALAQAGIAASDVRTQSFSVHFEQDPGHYHPPPRLHEHRPSSEKAQPEAEAEAFVRGHYRVHNMVEVTLRNLAEIGRVLRLATEAGANQVWGVNFEIEDVVPLQARARAAAIEHAKANAAELARLSGARLGEIVSISESAGHGGPMPMMKAMRAEMSHDVPIERGELSVSAQVQLVYALESGSAD